MNVKIAVTPSDREWLRFASRVLAGKEAPTDRQRKRAAGELERLAYRADVAERATA